MGNKQLNSDKVYEIMKNRIIKLEYDPGQVLNEVELAKEFNMSRTPIRKVFQNLSNDKLLNVVPRFGAQVTPIDFKHMKYIFEITRELDPFAAKLAIERISCENTKELEEIVARLKKYDIHREYQSAINDDERFHNIIYSSCENPWLKDMLTTLHYHTERLWHYCEWYFDNMDLFANTLEKILEGIKEKDLEKVERYTKKHIDDFILKIKKELF